MALLFLVFSFLHLVGLQESGNYPAAELFWIKKLIVFMKSFTVKTILDLQSKLT